MRAVTTKPTTSVLWSCASHGSRAGEIRSFLCLLACLLLSAEGVNAQTPDAGQLLQQIEKGLGAALPKKLAPEAPPAPRLMEPPVGATVTVSSFRFSGNTLLSAQQLAPAVAGFLNRSLDFAELQEVASVVAETYRKAGWIVRAYLPQQDITDGILTIQIVEAVFGKAILDGTAPARLKFEQALSMVYAQQAQGLPLNAEAIDRALLLLDDIPGVSVIGNLTEGDQDGETDLALKLANEPLFQGDVTVDNTGSRSTGAQRLAANLLVNSPMGQGDLVSINLFHTEGSDYARVAASVPLGPHGWRVGLNTSHLIYKLVAPEFVALRVSGASTTVGLDTTYPLLRSRVRNVYLTSAYDQKTFDNQADGVISSRYKASALTLGLSANAFDSWGGGGANSASLSWANGYIDLDGSPNQSSDATTTQAQGAYHKWRYAISRQQTITDDLSLFAAYSGQVASKNMDSSEKFSLGGSSGIRAHPSGEASGSEGQTINLELRYQLPQNLTLTGFYDWGQVTVNRNNNFEGASTVNNQKLQGAGVSLAWQTGFGLNVKATLARRVGSNPNPTSTGNDQDGSLTLNRLWLTASLQF